jgi:hypothetical protein
VVAAAGISGTTHFAGPRWVPDWFGSLKIGSSQHAHPLTSVAHGRPPKPTPGTHGAGGHPIGLVLWIAVAIAALCIARLLWRWWAGRRSRGAATVHSAVVGMPQVIRVVPDPEPDRPALRTGIEHALQVLDEHRDPTDAIVRAWLGLQETAEESGIVRQPAETPTEFTSRILSRAFGDDRAVRTLLRLYLRTRFGDHPVTSDDVAVVRLALQELVRTWPAPTSTVGTRSR